MTHNCLLDEIRITLGELLEASGNKYRTTWKESNRMKDIIAALKWLEEKEYIKLPEGQLEEFRFNQVFTIRNLYAGIPIEKYKSNGTPILAETFTKLEVNEYRKLIVDTDSSNRVLDLFLYLFIKSHINQRGKSQTIEDHPMYWHFSQNKLAEAAATSKPTAINSLTRLEEELSLIKTRKLNAMRTSVAGLEAFLNLDTIYVLQNSPDYKAELEYGARAYVKYIKTHTNKGD